MTAFDVREGRTITGPAGRATELLMSGDPAHVDQTATLAAWFLECPGQSLGWAHYLLAVIHLRPIPGQSKPAHIRVAGATHEVLEHALDPRLCPCPTVPATWCPLFPLNVQEQVHLRTDAEAVELVELCAIAVVNGQLWAEPPLSLQVEPWRTALIKTTAHLRGEEHAS